MLHLHALAKHYAETPVFSHVDLEARSGEFIAILGESGVGKSTLLNCIAGLDEANGGSVELDGVNVFQLGEEARARWRREKLGFVFQAFHVLPHLSVSQNIALPLLLLQRPDPARVKHMLDVVGLQGFDERLPRTLSGGQLQRVAIARALVHKPALLLADEPTGNLDPGTAERVLTLLLDQARAEGAICLLVTHSQSAAARADRALRLTATGFEPVARLTA
ncbi:ABC transporter ATP-binding protein [Azohydromonas caseinilytica]|uniref:ABC transporter ATP-binding protein n=1 Tax=Azohydromonas caseinilytica TaxID=2728836 RepID=A0A848F869_9BURK|nr:ABC transporter ATP-binding protein [Azohydromonas caseinilytica]NML15552.1 ABC transporter ATP-binding protein [Azohydromonas caseinilytica]